VGGVAARAAAARVAALGAVTEAVAREAAARVVVRVVVATAAARVAAVRVVVEAVWVGRRFAIAASAARP